MLGKACLPVLLNAVFDGYTPRISDWIRLIPIVVSLNKEPVGFVQSIEAVHPVRISFYNCPFIALGSTDDVIDGSSYSGCLELL